ncbi:MAG: alpha-2-macroglobulin [Bacteroidales bacterium]|nr:alpha-2-macroglobulin [Bacteroidales bacterium]
MKTIRFILTLAAAAALFAACQGSGPKKPAGPAGPTVSAVRGESDLALPGESANPRESDIDPEVPTIRFISKGSILPSSGGLDLLFGSVSYAKAQVRVKKVYSNNILQFLQLDSYETRYELYKVADVIADTTLVLGDRAADHIREWKTYALSLDELVKPEPGAIYHIEIRGREPLVEEDFWDSDSAFGNYETYEERSVDLLASDLALIAKKGDGGAEVFAYDILSGKPVSGVRVKLYSFAQQELAKGQTDREGHVSFADQAEGRFVVATNGKQYAYLDLKYEKALSTSNFDVSGTTHEGGIKAFIFGERGVWRPGDTLHVSVVTLFDDAPLPAGHPVTAQLRNPDGQVVQTLTDKSSPTNLYHFPFVTAEDAPSGRWNVQVNVGGQTFYKTLRVEAIKPNKLDINMHFPAAGYVTSSRGDNSSAGVTVAWLYGAPGSDLKMNGSLELSAGRTAFKGWEDYDFQDDARSFDNQSFTYNDFKTGQDGTASLSTVVDINKSTTPGMLNAAFTLRAFEPSGEFSTSYASVPMSPFDTYVGIKTELQKDKWGDRYIQAGKAQKFDVATVDADGKAVNTIGLHAEVYHVNWSWWWDASGEIAGYMASRSKELLFEKTFNTSGGKASFSYDWADAPYGLYYIRVTDARGGHATSMLCEVNSSEATDASEGSTQLNMLIDKEKYAVGETARITIPSAAGASALVSVEKGGRILSTRRVECYAGSTEIRIPVTREMTPNAYASIALIQPHGNVHNDAPIRLYGVQNINVEDPDSHLSPVIDIPAETKPESTLNFKVKEENGRAMSYIVALVDEGLLSLTGFKTPDAWSAFYAKEALRVRTWDEYDSVIGAYGGHIEQLFAIGGDEDGSNGPLKRQGADRFKPVVAYLGPFDLKAGKTASHSVEVPQYIGALRAMVIATDGKAQGSASKDVNVTQPVMVQATLPRTLSIGETIRIPSTVITLKDGVGKVKLDIKTDDLLTVKGPSTLETNIQKAGQQVEYFEVQVGEQTGIAHVTVTAQAGSDKSVSNVEIDVFNPNPPVTRVQSFLLEAGKEKEATAELFGIPGTNSVSVELSSIPSIDLGRRLKYLIEYPYGCVEQTISAAFPQLYLSQVMDCDENTVARSARNVTAAINRLHSFRRPDGSLSYWPGNTSSSSFGTAYALHFLQEAENQGFAVPADLKAGLVRYLTNSVVSNKKEDDFVRAYGLYALAAAGKPQRSAMSLLREQAKKMPRSAVWMLAGAFASDGKKQVATSLVNGLPYLEASGQGYYNWYGSEDRNMAIALRTSILTGDKEGAFELAEKVAANLNDGQRYMNTQATAWSLYAICDYARANAGGGVIASVKGPEKSYKVSTTKTIVRQDIALPKDEGKSAKLNVSNTGSGPVHAVISVTGTPKAGTEKAKSSGLSMKVTYVGADGAPVGVDTLSRGRNFKAVVTVTNTGSAAVRDLALAQKFPSGWEIQNDRIGKENYSYPAGITYQDIRDDRVYSFFDLGAGQSVTITTGLTATYPGKFYLPAVSCEAMYDDKISALVPGKWTEVK